MKNLTYFILLAFLLLFGARSNAQVTTRDQIIYDMAGPVYRTTHQGYPWGKHEGVLEDGNTAFSGFDWYEGAKPGSWIYPGITSGQYQGITTWGQAYPEEGYIGSGGTLNFRVQIRNLKLYAYRGGNWDLIIDTPSPDVNTGWSNYTYAFAGAPKTSNARSEASNGGGISITMPSNAQIHWWDNYWPRAAMPTTATAVFAYAELRLIPDTDPNINLNNVKVLAAQGIDTYTSRTAVSSGEPVVSAGIPRHKYVTSEWKSFTMYVIGNPAPTTYEQYVNLIDGLPLPPGVTNGGSVAVTGVSVSPTIISMGLNQTSTITATVLPSNASNKSVNWSSSNPSVATVNSSGVVSSVSVGTTTITATTDDGGFTATTTVTVENNPENGIVNYQKWSGITGTTIANLTSNANYPDNPTSTSTLTSLELPTDADNNYGVRIYGNITPQTTGSYTFYVAADDAAELYLSTNGDPANKSMIASTAWTNSREWNKYASQQSAAKSLTAGQKYYFEILMKEGEWGDNLAVGWTGPGISNITVIGSAYLSTYTGLVPDPVAVTGVSVAPTTLSLYVGNSSDLTETVYPADATDKSVSWTSSNSSVASVDQNGLVTAHSDGNATITVTTNDGSFTASCSVSVSTQVINPTGISVSPSSTSVYLNNTVQLSATVEPSNATNKTVSWTSSNSSIATVNSNGLVTGVGLGTASITATTVNGITATSSVTVNEEPDVTNLVQNPEFDNGTNNWYLWNNIGANSSMSVVQNGGLSGANSLFVDVITPSSTDWYICLYQPFNLEAGKEYQISFTAKASGAKTIKASLQENGGAWATYWTQAVNLTTSAQTFGPYTFNCNVTKLGDLKFFLALGSADVWIDNVIITDGSGQVIVPTSVSVSPTSATINEGQTQQLTATVLPANASDKTVSWSSSNTGVATVNQSGLVSAVSAGTATITATTNSGGLTASSAITIQSVTVPVTGVTCTPTSITIQAGETAQITENVLPANASNKAVTWGSANSSIATVNSSGLITAVSEGSTTITVTTNDGGFTANCAVTVEINGGGDPIDYLEDFNDNIAQDWSAVSGTWAPYNYTYYNSSTAASELSVYNGSTFADFTYTVKANSVWNNWYGVIFNYQDNNNYYYVWLKASTNIELRRVKNGTTSTLATGTYSGGSAWVYSTVEVSNNGTSTTIKVNGGTVFSNISTTDWAYGKIGLWSDWNPVYFDDVHVVAGSTLKSDYLNEEHFNEVLEELSVYPNPINSSSFTVNLGSRNIRKVLTVSNMTGKKLYSKTIENQQYVEIETNKLNGKGLYLVTVEWDNNVKTIKVLYL